MPRGRGRWRRGFRVVRDPPWTSFPGRLPAAEDALLVADVATFANRLVGQEPVGQAGHCFEGVVASGVADEHRLAPPKAAHL